MTYNSPGNRDSLPHPVYDTAAGATIDFGLRQYMLRVYIFMAAGLGDGGRARRRALSDG
jgi:hypothetical protein